MIGRVRYIIFLLVFSYMCEQTMLAQEDSRNLYVLGKVHNTQGVGIVNVAVTDGFNIVQTDENGEYKLLRNVEAEYVYISIPSGYEIPMKAKAPLFFRAIGKAEEDEGECVFDFELHKLEVSDHKHVTVVWADPQVYYEEELPELQLAVCDLKNLIKNEYSTIPAYGIVPGDMIGWIKDADSLYPAVKNLIGETGIPFFYAVGNHDIDIKSSSEALSKVTYKKYFGPNYYSFNRGKIHYIVLDNVFYPAQNNSYMGYLDSRQLAWLEQDLAAIPHGSTIILTMHIPSYSPHVQDDDVKQLHKVLQNRAPLYKMLEPYNVHIFSGHEHYIENYEIRENLFEHVHTTLSGLFWMAPWSWDGSPRGYAVYEIDGKDIKWYYKSLGNDKAFQFNIYPVGVNQQKPDAFTINVWNYDPAWRIYWYEDEVMMGEMIPFTGYDSSIVDYVSKHQSSFKHKGVGAAPTGHMFYAIPKQNNSMISVKVVDRFGTIYSQDLECK